MEFLLTGEILLNMEKLKPLFKNEIVWMWSILLTNILVTSIFYSSKNIEKDTLLLVRNITLMVCSLFAAGALFRTTLYLKSWDMTKKSWSLLALGFTFWFYKEIYQTIMELGFGHSLSIPSPADALWLAGFISMCISLVLFLYGYHRTGFLYGHWAKYAFIILLVSFLEIILTYKFLIYIIYSPTLNVVEKCILLFYPLSDLVLLALTFFLVLVTSVLGKGLLSGPWKYLATGFVLLSVGDILYSYYSWFQSYSLGSAIDIMTAAGYLFMALSAFYQKELMERFAL